MKRLSAVVLGLILMAVTVIPGSAQGTAAATCSDFQIYWETLVTTIPDDQEGLDAFLEIVDAGPRTTLTEDQQVAAYQFLGAWSTNISGVDETVIPASARVYHQELVDEFDMTASLIEYGDLVDLADTFAYWSVGIYILLIDEAETPAQCI
jgi:hypothetical protein